MVNNMTHIYIHDTNRSYLGIGYTRDKIIICNFFSKNLVG